MARVGWLALSVGFLALYLAFSINQALSNGVEDIDGCESFQPIYGGALLLLLFMFIEYIKNMP